MCVKRLIDLVNSGGGGGGGRGLYWWKYEGININDGQGKELIEQSKHTFSRIKFK